MPGESDVRWNTMCICWPFVSHSLKLRYVYVVDKVPVGLDVYGRTADEEATYTRRVKRSHSECSAYTYRIHKYVVIRSTV